MFGQIDRKLDSTPSVSCSVTMLPSPCFVIARSPILTDSGA